MSWSCEVCGDDRTGDHRLCGISATLENLRVTLEQILEVLISIDISGIVRR